MPTLFSKPAEPDLKAHVRGERSDYDFWDPRAELAVNVALAADRPLLIRGPAGCGKSSLARAVAGAMDWSLIEATITARTEPQDLLWELDVVARLADAQLAGALDRESAQNGERHRIDRYVRPGPLWWAFDTVTAKEQQARLAPSCRGAALVQQDHQRKRCVLLLDEIDKADPDLPNALLEAFDGYSFHVAPLGLTVRCQTERPLVVVTTNEYRELSRPFLRRCVELRMTLPDVPRLVEIACYHFGDDSHGIYEALAKRCVELRPAAGSAADLRPGPAEYLDAVRACRELGIRPGTPEWDWLIELSMTKAGPE